MASSLMYRLWLIFSQAATIAVAVLFVVSTFRPEWLPSRAGAQVPLSITQPSSAGQMQLAARSGPAPASYYDAVQRATPSVVNIFTSKEIRSPKHPLLNDPIFRRFFGDQLPDEAQRASSLGSGVIVSASGYVMLAIGNPFGVGQTVTGGIVSALGRTGLGINTFENFIQTDAAINPGNSGGALIDTAGNLVGINTAIYSRSGGSLGIGFAIPASSAKQIMEQIIETGSVTRGWIGVEAQEITPEIADSFRLSSTNGVLIAGVLRGGPAEKAGLKPGDILVAIEGKSVKDPNSMLNLVAALVPGKPASIRLKRDNKDVEVQVAVGKRPTQQRRRRCRRAVSRRAEF